MAVIYRKTLTGEAADIANKAYTQAAMLGNQNVIALQQQQNVLDAQQSSLVQSTRQTLGNVQQNIYQAQRSKRATNAALGMIGQASALREQADLQRNISNELSNIINQTEQGAINLAGQQSAINQALVQSASDTILDQYTETLIEQGNSAIRRDTGREVLNTVVGTFLGGIKGGFGAWGATKGIQQLISPTGGIIKKALIGGGLSLGANMLLSDIGGVVQGFGGDWIDEYDNKLVSTGLIGLGVIGGGLSRIGYQKQTLDDINKKIAGVKADWLSTDTGSGTFKFVQDPKTGAYTKKFLESETARVARARQGLTWRERFALDGNKLFPKGTKASTKFKDIWKSGDLTIGGKLKATGSKIAGAEGFFKVNPWVLAAGVGVGALLGGLKAGTQKKYRVDLDALRTQGTAQQFESMGLDLSALADKVYNYKG